MEFELSMQHWVDIPSAVAAAPTPKFLEPICVAILVETELPRVIGFVLSADPNMDIESLAVFDK